MKQRKEKASGRNKDPVNIEEIDPDEIPADAYMRMLPAAVRYYRSLHENVVEAKEWYIPIVLQYIPLFGIPAMIAEKKQKNPNKKNYFRAAGTVNLALSVTIVLMILVLILSEVGIPDGNNKASDVFGDVSGDVSGDASGDVSGDVSGDAPGNYFASGDASGDSAISAVVFNAEDQTLRFEMNGYEAVWGSLFEPSAFGWSLIEQNTDADGTAVISSVGNE